MEGGGPTPLCHIAKGTLCYARDSLPHLPGPPPCGTAENTPEIFAFAIKSIGFGRTQSNRRPMEGGGPTPLCHIAKGTLCYARDSLPHLPGPPPCGTAENTPEIFAFAIKSIGFGRTQSNRRPMEGGGPTPLCHIAKGTLCYARDSLPTFPDPPHAEPQKNTPEIFAFAIKSIGFGRTQSHRRPMEGGGPTPLCHIAKGTLCYARDSLPHLPGPPPCGTAENTPEIFAFAIKSIGFGRTQSNRRPMEGGGPTPLCHIAKGTLCYARDSLPHLPRTPPMRNRRKYARNFRFCY